MADLASQCLRNKHPEVQEAGFCHYCTRTNDQKNGETGLRGKFIALDDGAGDNFEWGNLIYCAQFEDSVIGE